MITPLELVGVSSDGRTNQWRATCPSCKKKWKPRTSMLAMITEVCPKCEAVVVLDMRANVEQARLARIV